MTQGPATPPRQAAQAEGGRRLRLGAVIAVVLAVAFGAWLILRDGDDETSGPTAPPATAVTVEQLRALPPQRGHDVYWAGRRSGYTYELTETTDGNIFIRYLPAGVGVGDERPDYLTVGTYPRRNAIRGLRRISRRRASVSFTAPPGGVAVYSRDRPSSVYVAYPGDDVQIEVYDPSPAAARALVRDGRIRPLR